MVDTLVTPTVPKVSVCRAGRVTHSIWPTDCSKVKDRVERRVRPVIWKVPWMEAIDELEREISCVTLLTVRLPVMVEGPLMESLPATAESICMECTVRQGILLASAGDLIVMVG